MLALCSRPPGPRPIRSLAVTLLLGVLAATLATGSASSARAAGPYGRMHVDVGVDPPMRWRARTAALPDLCAPCNAGSQCDSGMCALDASMAGICTQVCDAATPCPDNFTCTDTPSGAVCYPADDTVCPSPYAAPLNTFCNVPANSDPNLLIRRSCDVGLTCFVFPSEYGACVSACSALDANQSCKYGQRCCFGTDANGACAASSATQGTGGCFQVQQPGDSCAQPDHSFCAQGSTCLFAQTASAAKCYSVCSATQACGVGGTCQSFQGQSVCCDAKGYNPEDPSTCAPFAGICQREVGVVCQANADCRLGLCQRNGSQAACSTPCTTDADCPSASEDVNGDGVADGGSTCQSFGGERRCWPAQGPAAAPACATAPSTVAPPDKNGGCSCAQSQLWPWQAALAAAVALGRRMRRARRP